MAGISIAFLKRSSIASSKIRWLFLADYRRYFDEPGFRTGNASGRTVSGERKMARLAPRKLTRAESSTSHWEGGADHSLIFRGMERHDLYPDRVQCRIARRSRPKTSFRCMYNLTNSNGNAAIPLSSYGLTSLSREMFEAFARPVRRVSC